MTASKPSLNSVLEHIHVQGEVCPWCEQPIPEDQSEEIRERIKQREKNQQAALKQTMEREFAQKTEASKRQFAKEKAQAEERARKEMSAEKDKAIEQLKKDAAEKESAARKEAQAAAEAAAATKLAEAAKTAKAAESKLQTLQANQESEIKKRLTEQRSALEKDKAAAVNAERTKIFNEKLKLEEQVNKLQRKLEQKTADELGEGAEIDLLDLLKGEFKDDHIKHVGKGKPGVDIIHDVKHNGKICGHIVYDAKNRTAWRNEYVSKLRRDQIAAKAEYAILSTNVFPAGARQLHEQEGVIIANPARVLSLVRMLRRITVQMHTLRLSNQERDEKTAALYEFIRSDRCNQLFDRIDEHAESLLEFQEKEIKQHEANWKRQGNLYREIQKASGNLTVEIDRIIGSSD